MTPSLTQPPAMDRGTVMIVDDSAEDAYLIREALVRIGGYRCEPPFSYAEEALDRAKDNGLIAIIIDIRLPDMDGVDLARALRIRGVGTPVILVSSQVEDRDEKEARTIAWCGIVEKSGDGAELVKTLDALIDRHYLHGQGHAILHAVQAMQAVQAKTTEQLEKIEQKVSGRSWGPIGLAGLLTYRGTVMTGFGIVISLVSYILHELGFTGLAYVLGRLDDIAKEASKE